MRKVIIILDRIVRACLIIPLCIMTLYSGYCLYANWEVEQAAKLPKEILTYKPGNGYTLEDLKAINQDVKGWITLDNTNIDYPVVQGSTNFEYINKDVTGKTTLSGSIFIDAANNPNFTDPYTIIYGHHMDSGKMFGDIDKYSSIDYFNSHLTGKLTTSDETEYSISVFAYIETDCYDLHFYGSAALQGDLTQLLPYVSQTAKNVSNQSVSDDAKIIALSTCSNGDSNGRMILLCTIQ